MEKIEEIRRKGMSLLQMQSGWDEIHNLFLENNQLAFGRYTDLFWG